MVRIQSLTPGNWLKNMQCSKCDAKAVGILVDDVLNLSKGGIPLCAECAGHSEEIHHPDGSITRHEVKSFHPDELAKMINPDIGCDFCEQPDPLYQWTMEHLVLGNMDFGTRWVGCAECGDLAERGDFVSTALRNPQSKKILKRIVQLHMLVMQGLGKREYYVRDPGDGRVKIG